MIQPRPGELAEGGSDGGAVRHQAGGGGQGIGQTGPLALGDTIGAATVLAILENLQACYGDPRYRPSPWLRRRALLGASLLTPES